ncbi:hypothetical protein D3C86_1995960 [compost metagenome]
MARSRSVAEAACSLGDANTPRICSCNHCSVPCCGTDEGPGSIAQALVDRQVMHIRANRLVFMSVPRRVYLIAAVEAPTASATRLGAGSVDLPEALSFSARA